jgi:hypothetical protein
MNASSQAKRQYSGIYATILAFFIHWRLMMAILTGILI